jgi:hypothetical protein
MNRNDNIKFLSLAALMLFAAFMTGFLCGIDYAAEYVTDKAANAFWTR